MLSDGVTAFLCESDKLTNEELIGLVGGILPKAENGLEADVFTYGSSTLIIAYPAEPMRDRFDPKMRIKRKGRTRL